MQHTDLSEKFEKISDRAKAATDELKAAGDTSRDKLETDGPGARDKATAAADQLKTKADDGRDGASSQWQTIRDSWHSHVAKARKRVKNTAKTFDARQAALDGNLAEDYASDAIDFALNAIDEGEAEPL